MADEHRFSADVEGPSVPTEGKSRWQSCLTGCLVVFVILLVIAILIGVWIARNARDWAATGVTEVVRQAMVDSQLPAQEQKEIMIQVERVTTAFREKKISLEQVGELMEKLAQSPLMSLVGATMIEQHYFAKSGLSDEEKATGRQTLQRFIRGSIDKKINQAGIDAAMAHVADRRGGQDGDWEIRETLSDDELRAFLAEAKKQADAAAIPDQPADIDPSEEIKKIVDEALAAPQAAPQ
jgi:hypothetical protein